MTSIRTLSRNFIVYTHAPRGCPCVCMGEWVVCECVRAWLCVRVCVRVYVNVCAWMSGVCVCVHMRACVRICRHITIIRYVCICICACVRMYVDVWACICMCIVHLNMYAQCNIISNSFMISMCIIDAGECIIDRQHQKQPNILHGTYGRHEHVSGGANSDSRDSTTLLLYEQG